MTGIVFLDKPAGMTSFSAVSRVRKILGIKKAGHTGTLDPMATGVLPVMLGGATRFIDFLSESGKKYEAVIRLGTVTDTLDIEGKILAEREVTVTKADFLRAAERFRGKIMQTPPMYSAIKIGGERLYDLARQGVEVEREAREVTVRSFELLGCDEEKNEYTVEIACSAGTYIRTISSDIGEILGCGAVLTSLRRTYANGVDIKKCVTLKELESLGVSAIHKTEELLNYPELEVSAAQAVRFSNGGALDLKRLKTAQNSGLCLVKSPEGEFLGLGEILADSGEMAVKRVMVR